MLAAGCGDCASSMGCISTCGVGLSTRQLSNLTGGGHTCCDQLPHFDHVIDQAVFCSAGS